MFKPIIILPIWTTFTLRGKNYNVCMNILLYEFQKIYDIFFNRLDVFLVNFLCELGKIVGYYWWTLDVMLNKLSRC